MFIKYFHLLVFIVFLDKKILSEKNSLIEDFSLNKITVVRKKRSAHCRIIYITYNKTSYLIKQKFNENSNFWSIAQAMVADVFAHSVETISSQRVKVIPGYISFRGKIHKNIPAALITVVPGVSINKWRKGIRSNVIKDRTKKLIRHFFLKQLKGMRKSILSCISLHYDLASIFALHMLLGFYDAHPGNVFYDQESDKFSVIDMDSLFNIKINLAEQTYRFLKKHCVRLNGIPGIKKALLQVADTLELLMERNDIKKIKVLAIKIFDVLTENNSQRYIKRIKQIENFLCVSYASAKRLINFIRKEIMQSTSRVSPCSVQKE